VANVHQSNGNRRLFWLLQLSGWSLYATITILSYFSYLHGVSAVAHQGAIIAIAVLGSFPLYRFCRFLWGVEMSPSVRVVCAYAASYLIALCGSFIRLWFGFHRWRVPSTFAISEIFASSWSDAIVLVCWSSCYFGIKYYIAAVRQEQALREAEISKRDAQLEALQYQLQPHYLFNVLNSISTLVLSNEGQAASQMISRLSNLLRNCLEPETSYFTTLDDEVRHANYYLEIERVRFGSTLEVNIKIDEATRELFVPRWLLLPLLENSVRHGFASQACPNVIILESHRKADRLLLTLHNTVSAESQAQSSRGFGIGLMNTRKRLDAMYGPRAHLAIDEMRDSRFVVLIDLPATHEAETLSPIPNHHQKTYFL
jgi:two-component system sensor histidine kinase AlgZ